MARKLVAAVASLASRAFGSVFDRGAWVDEEVLGRAYPRTERAFEDLVRRGVRTIVNLHGRAHDPARLRRHGLVEVHLPVRDFTAPSPEQLDRGVEAILASLANGAVAVHCAGGLGRTGTLLACYLVRKEGLGAREAIEEVRRVRPGSVETRAQVETVEAFARRGGEARQTRARRVL